jgi:threonine/homoserine/homoserine lactone efflux protein
MSSASLAIFALTLFVYACTPGPNTAMVMARALAGDLRGTVLVIAGLLVGNGVLVMLIYAGIAVWLQSQSGIMMGVKWASVAYLLYLARAFWRDGGRPRFAAPQVRVDRAALLFGIAFATSLTNPQTMLFYVAIVPPILDLQRVSVAAYGQIALINALVLITVFGLITMFATQARRALVTPFHDRLPSRIAATIVAGTAIWVAAT